MSLFLRLAMAGFQELIVLCAGVFTGIPQVSQEVWEAVSLSRFHRSTYKVEFALPAWHLGGFLEG